MFIVIVIVGIKVVVVVGEESGIWMSICSLYERQTIERVIGSWGDARKGRQGVGREHVHEREREREGKRGRKRSIGERESQARQASERQTHTPSRRERGLKALIDTYQTKLTVIHQPVHTLSRRILGIACRVTVVETAFVLGERNA